MGFEQKIAELEADLRLARLTVDRQRDSIIENRALVAKNQRLEEALEAIAKKEHPNVGDGYCHWEGCNSPGLAMKALQGEGE